MSELPQGWATEKLVNVAKRITKGSTPTSYGYKFQEIGIRFVKVENIKNGEIAHSSIRDYISDEAHKNQSRSILEVGDILFSIAGTIGLTCLISEQDLPANTNQALAIIRGTEEVFTPEFLRYQLESEVSKRQAEKQARGGGMNNISLADVGGIETWIPPLNEQRRIVAKLEKLLAKCEACKQRLDKIPGILKRFRQSILAAACSGRLTADWRAQNPDVETASELLNKIRENRIKRLQESGKKNLSVDEFVIQETEDGLPEIPDRWLWSALGNYAECSRGRFSIRPRNDPRYYGGQYPFIQIGDLPREGGLVSNHRQTLNEDGLSISKMFSKGVVAIAIVGATIGNTGILAYDMCFPDSLVGIQTGSEVGNLYLDYYLRSEKENIRTISYAGGGQPNIKLETLNPYPFPLPPIEEQTEIVQRVEKLFKLADQIEQRYQKARAYVDKLPQSILAKAFRGELVPQDPTDEPASVLLERIRAEREQQEGKGERVTGKGKAGKGRKLT